MTLIKKVIILSVVIWFAISVARLVYNYIKIYSQEKNWIFKSIDEKKELMFGDVYPAMQFIAQNTPLSARIVIVMANPKIEPRLHYLSQYYLYPRRVSISQKIIHEKNIQYQVLYIKNEDLNLKKVKEVSGNKKSIIFNGKDISLILLKNHE